MVALEESNMVQLRPPAAPSYSAPRSGPPPEEQQGPPSGAQQTGRSVGTGMGLVGTFLKAIGTEMMKQGLLEAGTLGARTASDLGGAAQDWGVGAARLGSTAGQFVQGVGAGLNPPPAASTTAHRVLQAQPQPLAYQARQYTPGAGGNSPQAAGTGIGNPGGSRPSDLGTQGMVVGTIQSGPFQPGWSNPAPRTGRRVVQPQALVGPPMGVTTGDPGTARRGRQVGMTGFEPVPEVAPPPASTRAHDVGGFGTPRYSRAGVYIPPAAGGAAPAGGGGGYGGRETGAPVGAGAGTGMGTGGGTGTGGGGTDTTAAEDSSGVDWDVASQYWQGTQEDFNNWVSQYKVEHGGANPWDGTMVDPTETLIENIAALQWGQQFQLAWGRPPNEKEYQRAWYTDRFGLGQYRRAGQAGGALGAGWGAGFADRWGPNGWGEPWYNPPSGASGRPGPERMPYSGPQGQGR